MASRLFTIDFIFDIRKLNLLGKDAVNLLSASSKSIRSSRKQSHVTTQGFVNFFQVTSLGDEEDGGADDGEEGRKVHQDHLAGAHSDDILTRLRKLEGMHLITKLLKTGRNKIMFAQRTT